MYRCLIVLMVMSLSSAASAGHQGGPKEAHSTILPRHQDTYDLRLDESVQATVILGGDGSADLDCFLIDSNEIILDQDQSPGDQCLLKYTPKQSQKVRLVVRNLDPNRSDVYWWRTN